MSARSQASGRSPVAVVTTQDMEVGTKVENRFAQFKLDSGIDLYFKKTDKFKTDYMLMVVQTELKEDTATANALLPMVLGRGTRNCPSTVEFIKTLDDMYGAAFKADISKKGEVQMLVFGIEVPNARFLPENDPLTGKAMGLLRDVVFDTAVDDEGLLRTDYVAQEKENLRHVIEGIIDDKQSYAMKRCIEAMCEDERFGVSKFGRLDQIDQIDAKMLTQRYNEVASKSPIALFVVGDLDEGSLLSHARECFGFKRDVTPITDTVDEWKSSVHEVKHVTDTMDVTQGKLVIGYRTNTTYEDPDFPALLMMNGIFGGFTHSKLFQNVREKASLAYYASSSVEYIKGIMTVSAGIDCSNEERVLKIVAEQLDEIRAGNITQTEMDFTFKGLRSSLLMADDSVSGGVDFVLCDLVSGKTRTSKELIEELSKVTPQDVVRVANRVQQDTVYFLSCADGVGGGCDEE